MSSFIHLVCASQPLPLSIEKSPRLSYLLGEKLQTRDGKTREKQRKEKQKRHTEVTSGKEWSTPSPSRPVMSPALCRPAASQASYRRVALRPWKAPLSFSIQNIQQNLKLHKTRQSQIDARFTSRNHRSIIHKCDERGPLLRVPHSCNIRSLSGYGSHTGEVVLCWSLFEEARHEYTSDEQKTLWYIK